MTKGFHTRQLIVVVLLIIGGISSIAYSEDSSNKIKEIVNFAQEGKKSWQTKKPILLLVSREDCPYCVLIKSEILKPMIISGDYNNKIIIRELMLDPATEIRDFDGKIKETSNIADLYKIRVTPTLLFLGPKGKELTERIVGINTLELFSFYVDQAIDEAISKLHSR